MPDLFYYKKVRQMIKEMLILIILLSASITDIRRKEVPVIYQVLLLCLVPFCFSIENIRGVLIAVPFFIAAILTDKIGGGDFKIIALLGILIGLSKVFWTVVIGCVIFIISSLIIGKCKGQKNTLYPFIPALTTGYIITLILEAII